MSLKIVVFLVATCIYLAQSSPARSRDFPTRLAFGDALSAITNLLREDNPSGVSNTAISSVPLARDTAVFVSVLGDGKSKKYLQDHLHLYPTFLPNTREVTDEITWETTGACSFYTEFYVRQGLLNESLRAALNQSYDSAYLLVRELQLDMIDTPFTFYSRTQCNLLASIAPANVHVWREWLLFYPNDSAEIHVPGVATIFYGQHAVFAIPKLDCAIKAVKINIGDSNMFMVFLMPSDCLSLAKLWENLQNVDMRRINFDTCRTYLELPDFDLSVLRRIDLGEQLEAKPCSKRPKSLSRDLRDVVIVHETNVVFKPYVWEEGPIPQIDPRGLKIVSINRPFIFAVFHTDFQTPVLTALVNNPQTR